MNHTKGQSPPCFFLNMRLLLSYTTADSVTPCGRHSGRLSSYNLCDITGDDRHPAADLIWQLNSW